MIIGPNGAGKTTVLDLICGRTHATAGSIRFRGKELTRMKASDRFTQASVENSRTLDLRGSDCVRKPGISYPRGHSVFGALAFKRDAEVVKGGNHRGNHFPAGRSR